MASITTPTMHLAKGQLCFTASGKVCQPSMGNFSTEVKGAPWTGLKSSLHTSSARSLSHNLTSSPVKFERLVTKAMSEASDLKPLPGLPVDVRGKRAFIAGIADDNGYGWAIAKSLAAAAGTWVPAVSYTTPKALSVKTTGSDAKKKTNPIVVIDNYDSFTYNLCQYIGELGFDFEVYRNDELTLDELKRKNPRGILISPGPGAPQDSGISLQTVLELGPTVPLFGVCMGLQCIGEAFGGKIVRSPYGVMHGKSSLVYYNEGDEVGLFSGLSNPFTAGRYHSLVIEKESFPADVLEMTAWTEDGLIMAARHKTYKYLQGVQFHPESIITTEGKTIVHNFIKLIEKKEAECAN